MGSPMYTKKLFGTATVGSKGQVVIPADARDELNIKTGDRLYVVGSPDGGFLGLLKEESLEQLVQHMTSQIQSFQALKNEQNSKEK